MHWIDSLSIKDFNSLYPLSKTQSIRFHQKSDAAVLVPIFRRRQQWRVLFCHRTDFVSSHKDQVSFPGGGWEENDEDLISTVLRESFEEIQLKPTEVNIIGMMPSFSTVSSFDVTPFIGIIKKTTRLVLSTCEVKRVFSIPLSWLADETNSQFREFTRENGEKATALFYKKYRKETVWGVTGMIIYRFIEELKKKQQL